MTYQLSFNYKGLLGLILSLVISDIPLHGSLSLKKFSYNAAGVLPIGTQKIGRGTHTYVILGREAYGRDKGTYDAFGGSRDPHEHDPLITAARECAEEMISHRTMKRSVKDIEKQINPRGHHTTMVLAHQRFNYVLYITRFDEHIEKFLGNFYRSLKKTHSFKHQEKDLIATVGWETLAYAIKENKNQVRANVIDPVTNESTRALITLRPLLIKSLKPFFMNYTYQTGTNKKIRFYT